MLTIFLFYFSIRKATGFQQHHDSDQSLALRLELDAAVRFEQQPHLHSGQGRMGVLPTDVGAVSGKAINVASISFFLFFSFCSSLFSHLHVLALRTE